MSENLDEDLKSLQDDLKHLKELDRKRFGVENTLHQILWDGQIDDVEFNETVTALVLMMKKCCEDEEWKKQLYEIDLEDYKNDEEE